MTNAPVLKSSAQYSIPGRRLFHFPKIQSAGLFHTIAGIRQQLALQTKSAMKQLTGIGTFAYVQKTQNGVLLKQEEILKAFSVLITALLMFCPILFKATYFIQSDLLSNLVVFSPLALSFIQLMSVYTKKNSQALFIITWLLPALMVAVSLYNPQVNYSKVILILTLGLIFLINSNQKRLAGFVYLTLVYILIQLRYYRVQKGDLGAQFFSFELIMVPVFSLVVFLVLSRIKQAFAAYQNEIREQKEILEKKNASLEHLVLFSEQQREKLKRTVLLKEKLISIISHDVRVPLSSFKLLINSYEKGYITDKMVIDGLLETKKDLSKIDSMVMDLVNWSRSDAAATQQRINTENFTGMLDSVLSIYTLCAKNKRLSIVPEVNIPQHMCLAVPKRELEIIIRNLLSNAIKFSNPGNKIIVSLEAASGLSGSVATLTIKDFGTGMHPSTLKQINGNRMISGTGTFDEIGLGVGLSIVFDVINSHNLQYNIQSEPNAGTEFSINIPLISC